MSQRKEKYLRRALNQYDGIVVDVDQLKNRVSRLSRAVIDMNGVIGRLNRKANNERRAQEGVNDASHREVLTAAWLAAVSMAVAVLDSVALVVLAVQIF